LGGALPIRKIEQHLCMSWHTIKKYLEAPAQTPAARSRVSKLDRFKPTIAELLGKDARASAAVIEQRLRPLGYDGGHSILREYIHKVRPQPQSKRAFVRMEPEAGERFEVDWGHFGTLSYEGDQRKLYAFALVDGHSRMSYLEFTHSQCFTLAEKYEALAPVQIDYLRGSQEFIDEQGNSRTKALRQSLEDRLRTVPALLGHILGIEFRYPSDTLIPMGTLNSGRRLHIVMRSFIHDGSGTCTTLVGTRQRSR
jgi:hypothetical protein